ncbi:MAG TPA: hypothetical protein VK324_05610 [Tepidisphaeraceae bacterium]|nr:hypothetical protein [Tepidisphaeraceae bacterium]
MRMNEEDAARIRGKLGTFFSGMEEDLTAAGEAGADAIVQTTLAGIGEGDRPFAPYSASYGQTIDAVGGKSRGTTDLRGMFYPPGTGPTPPRNTKGGLAAWEKRQRAKGAGRRGYVAVTVAQGARTFHARTAVTRPQRGLTDPLSEMSRDLVRVEAEGSTLRIIYEPRARKHMIYHQQGDGVPRRVWFTADKAAVRGGMVAVVGVALKARAAWFNSRDARPAV